MNEVTGEHSTEELAQEAVQEERGTFPLLQEGLYDEALQASLEAEEHLEEVRDLYRVDEATASDLALANRLVAEANLEERRAFQALRVAREVHDAYPTLVVKEGATRGAELLNTEYAPGRMNLRFNEELLDFEEARLEKELAAWRELSQDQAQRIISGYHDARQEALARGEHLSRDEYLVDAFQEADFSTWTKDRVYVDIETTSLDPLVGEIIEVGIVRVAAKTGERTTYERVFGLENEHYLKLYGTGAEHIHQITPAAVSGQLPFSAPEVQAEVAAFLNDPHVVVVAHRDGFENAWFAVNLAGYAETHDPTDYCAVATQDTMWLSKFLVHCSWRSNLKSLVEALGGAYENAHRALPDAAMTSVAMERLSAILQESPRGQRPTKEHFKSFAEKVSLS